MTVAVDPVSRPEVAALLARGEEKGCINVSELEERVQALELTDEELEALHERIEARSIELSEDCARGDAEEARYRPEDLAGTTTDALQLFLNEIRRYELLTKGEEVHLAQRIEQGDLAAKERMINSNPVSYTHLTLPTTPYV